MNNFSSQNENYNDCLDVQERKNQLITSDLEGLISRLISLAFYLLCRRPSALEARIRRASAAPITTPPPIRYV